MSAAPRHLAMVSVAARQIIDDVRRNASIQADGVSRSASAPWFQSLAPHATSACAGGLLSASLRTPRSAVAHACFDQNQPGSSLLRELSRPDHACCGRFPAGSTLLRAVSARIILAAGGYSSGSCLLRASSRREHACCGRARGQSMRAAGGAGARDLESVTRRRGSARSQSPRGRCVWVTSDHESYATSVQATQFIGDYIDNFYNPIRRHSTLGSLSPIEFELKSQVAALAA